MTALVITEYPADHVARIVINRPEKLNPLSRKMILELAAEFERLATDGAVHCVILTGAGRAFSAGADLGEFIEQGDSAYSDPQRLSAWQAIEAFPKPVIAAINGYALGGGLELALLCDVLIAADTAKFGTPEIDVASFPGDGGTQRLSRLVGSAFAMHMILTGEMIDAATAERKGLIGEIVPANLLADRAVGLARTISKKSVAITPFAKRAVRAATQLGLEQGLVLERELVVQAFETEDRGEGLRAFVEKRAAKFKGR